MIVSLEEIKQRKLNCEYQDFCLWYGLEEGNKSWVLFNTWNILGDDIKVNIIYGDVSSY